MNDLVELIINQGDKLRRTRSGKPYCSDLSRLAKRRVSSRERDKAYLASLGQQLKKPEPEPMKTDEQKRQEIKDQQAAAEALPETDTIDGVSVRKVTAVPRPDNTPGGASGATYSPEIDKLWKDNGYDPVPVYHKKYGKLLFLRWDGGAAVTEHTKEHLDPNAPAKYPRMGAIPKGGKFWAPVPELYVEDN